MISLWVPPGQLWFLPWLALVTLLVVPLRPWRDRRVGVGVLVLAVLVSLTSWGWDPPIVGVRGLGLTGFFVAGVLTGGRFTRWVRTVPALVLVAAAATGAVLLTVVVGLAPGAATPTAAYPGRSPVTIAAGLVGAVAGAVLLLACAALLARTGAVGHPVAFLGERSLEIFLAHVVAASGTRIALSTAGVASPAVHVVLGTAAGLLLPLLAWWLARALGWGWLFGLPAPVRRALGRGG